MTTCFSRPLIALYLRRLKTACTVVLPHQEMIKINKIPLATRCYYYQQASYSSDVHTILQ